METMFCKASSRESKQKRIVAWSRAIATMLALASVASVAAGEREEVVASIRDNAAAEVSSRNVTAICLSTPYPRACETALSSRAGSSSRLGRTATRDDDPFAASVRFAMSRAASALALARNFSSGSSSARLHGSTKPLPSGMDDCAELLEISHGQLGDALASRDDADAVTTWLSAAMTNQGTCADSLAEVASVTTKDGAAAAVALEAVRARVSALAQIVGTSLALHANSKQVDGKAAGTATTTTAPTPPDDDVGTMALALPSWLSDQDKELLRSSSAASMSGVTVSAVVALDGSGTHRSIGDAIDAVTKGGGGGGGRKVIYVKAGRYEETVSIASSQKNVMLMGDGKGQTVIVGHKSVGDGYTTYASATVAAMGSGFIAKGLSIVNSAGPGKGQAVALRVGGDLSVVYQCAVQSYQDTLYVHSNRQFIADTDVSGTVDFIFGNAAVVLQRCDIQARRPGAGQSDTVTAQARTDPNQNTGISIHMCRVTAASDLGSTPVYLGRPWQKYSRTVVMKTFLDGSVAPAGWTEWSGQFALSTLYYGEYGNTGPGAATASRVTWSGVHSSMSASEASTFTVANFILGNSWLPGTGVSYVSGL